MKKRFLAVTMALVLMLALTTTVFGATELSTVTTFNDTIEISNITKTGDTYTDESFDMDKIDKVLEASNKPIPVEGGV